MGMLRVSAAILNRISFHAGGLLLSVNNKGTHALTPIGGGIEFHEPARNFLTRLGVTLREGNDLRFTFDSARINEFERWFSTRTDRDISPFRELRQELVEEEHILTDLRPDQVQSALLWTAKPPLAASTRPGSEGELTQRYIEVFDTYLSMEIKELLEAHLAAPEPKLAIVSPEEIMAGISLAGEKIGAISQTLLSGA